MTAEAHVGTSGWHYAHWRGPFYPIELKSADWLPYYAERFRCVEINNSFYRLPRPETFDQWKAQTPAGFRFAVKAWRVITHRRKLKDAGAALDTFFAPLQRLGRRRGPVLFQLPPHWRCNPDRLYEFLRLLPRSASRRYTFEFRDPSWHNETVYELLRARDAAFCIFELGENCSPRVVTARFAYVRLHGPAGPYLGSYTRPQLRRWAKRLQEWRGQGIETWLFFDNDQAGYAARNALELKEMIGA